jgi:hypothetical protein
MEKRNPAPLHNSLFTQNRRRDMNNIDYTRLSNQTFSDVELINDRHLYDCLSTVDRLTRHVKDVIAELHENYPSLAGEVHPRDAGIDASVKRVAMQTKMLHVVICSLVLSTRRLLNAIQVETKLSACARDYIMGKLERSIYAMEGLCEIDAFEERFWDDVLKSKDK